MRFFIDWQNMLKDNLWACVIAAYFAIVVFSGANIMFAFERLGLLAGIAVLLLLISLWRLRSGLPNKSSSFGFLILCLGLIVMALQLVPLPPQIWLILPGREFVIKDLSVAGLPIGSAPLSLSPYLTKQDMISLLPAIAACFSILSLPVRSWRVVGWSVAVIALIAAMIGLAQRFQGPNGVFHFYPEYGIQASGFFANRNFQAALLYSTIPLIGALTLQSAKARVLPNIILVMLGVTYVTILIAGLGATGSRMGALLGMVAIFTSALLLIGSGGFSQRGGASRFGLIGIFIGVIVFAQLCLTALLRFVETDTASDYRSTVYAVSFNTLKAFFPLGSGFGSFVPAYQLFEQPETLQAAYVNHAHSDWMELVLEGGLPMLIVLILFVGWFLQRVFVIWRRVDTDLLSKAASLSAGLLMLHSIVDYPLRTPALMTLFGMFCGMIAANSANLMRSNLNGNKPKPASATVYAPVTFQSHKKGFSQRNDPPR